MFELLTECLLNELDLYKHQIMSKSIPQLSEYVMDLMPNSIVASFLDKYTEEYILFIKSIDGVCWAVTRLPESFEIPKVS